MSPFSVVGLHRVHEGTQSRVWIKSFGSEHRVMHLTKMLLSMLWFSYVDFPWCTQYGQHDVTATRTGCGVQLPSLWSGARKPGTAVLTPGTLRRF